MPAKKFPVLAAIIVLIFGAVFIIYRPSSSVKINDATYQVRIADDDIERQKGLMDVKKLPENHGMLFIFDSVGQYDFWNKNTLIPLDLIYIRNGIIVEIGQLPIGTQNQNPTIYQPKQLADMVLEINAGKAYENNIKVNDEVRILRWGWRKIKKNPQEKIAS